MIHLKNKNEKAFSNSFYDQCVLSLRLVKIHFSEDEKFIQIS